MTSLTERIIPMISSAKTSKDVWDRLSTALTTDELTLAGSVVPNTNLILHVLNGVGSEYKDIVAAVRARDTPISLEELHDKLIEYESFLAQEVAKHANGFTANAAQYNRNKSPHSQYNNRSNDQHSQFRFNQYTDQHSNGNSKQSGGYTNNNNSSKRNFFYQYCDKKGHVAKDCHTLKRLLGILVPPKANPCEHVKLFVIVSFL
ncbi:Uncharacterized protein TCM_042528 [Theobroma cacao]|uniref:CCHC-type domain-containing protein n=1 Tax=Theobroma cacao TaxID=3641 RepID=A0A061FL48_THECC|nr:Uncharacterized protein TCM_042528 [Theobroma cacao]